MKNRLSRSCILFLALIVISCATDSSTPAASDGGATQGDATDGAAADGDAATDGAAADGDAATDGAAADGDAATDVDSSQATHRPLLPCTSEVGSCPARPIAIWQELLDAADFGADARLVGMGNQAVLVALGDGTFRIARLPDPFNTDDSAPPYSSWEFPSTGAQPIAVTEGRVSNIPPVPPRMLIVVTCDAARTRCSMWRSDVNQDELTPWQETELPSGLLPRRLAFDSGVEPRKVCVYGNGMFCLDDTWQEEIASSPDLQINAVVFGVLWSLAVGERGRWFKRERGDSGELEAWQEQPPLGDVGLTQASVAGAGGVITGEGMLQAAVGEQADLFDCSPSNDLVAFMLAPSVYGGAYAVTSTGEVLQHALVSRMRAEPYCAYQQLAVPGTVLETATVPCQDAINPRVLTDRALLGENLCLRIIQ